MELEEAKRIVIDIRNGKGAEMNKGQQAIDIVLKELDKKDKAINKAIGHIEVCKTALGNYVLSPSETEYLIKILKQVEVEDEKI